MVKGLASRVLKGRVEEKKGADGVFSFGRENRGGALGLFFWFYHLVKEEERML